jgi:hypothetical protein
LNWHLHEASVVFGLTTLPTRHANIFRLPGRDFVSGAIETFCGTGTVKY